MLKIKKFTLAAGALALSAGAVAAPATLRVADSLPVGHYISGNLVVPWMERVTELTGGDVKFEYFPAEQMGKPKDMLALVQSGAVDIAYIGVTYTPDKLPLSAVGELPEAFTTSCEGSKAYWEVAKPGTILDKEEFSRQKVRMLMESVLTPYQIFSAKKDISTLDSLKGMKIRATGSTKELAIKELGAVPVAISPVETREAQSRGTVDGSVFNYSSAMTYGIDTVSKYATRGLNMGSFIASYMISDASWKKLSEEQQRAMEQAADEIMPKSCAAMDKLDDGDRERMAKAGVEIVTFSAEDMKKLEGILAGIGTDWAGHLDKMKKPGTEVLEAFRKALGN